jgi:hypothetical protein
MPAVSKISETVKQQVVSDYLAGVPVSVIMSQHVVSHMQVRGILKARNTPRRRPGNPKLLQPVGKLIQPVAIPSQPVVSPPPQRKPKTPVAAAPVDQDARIAELRALGIVASPEAEEAKRWGKINTQAKLNALSLEDRVAYTKWRHEQGL